MRGRPIEERLWPRLEVVGDCWVWTGGKKRNGYGYILEGQPSDKKLYVHRVAYQLANECVIHPSLQLDHLCRNPSCANPHHLEEVTPKENTHRGRAAEAHRALHFISLTCAHGHAWTPENTSYSKDGHVRSCRACGRKTTAEYKARRKLKLSGCPEEVERP